jgi:transcriptional regulator with XRE-family HTH domain
MPGGDDFLRGAYHENMAKRRTAERAVGPDWFLVEWMRYFGKSQADMCRLTGFSKATMHDIYHGKTEYYRGIINTLADALEVRPYELLMPPDLAHAYRRYHATALQVAAQPEPPPFRPQASDEPGDRRRA